MRRVLAASVVLTLLTTTGAAAAQSAASGDSMPGVHEPAVQATLSNRTLALEYLTSGRSINFPDAQVSAGALLTEDRDTIGAIGAVVPLDIQFLRGFSTYIGPRAYIGLLGDENQDFFALGLGLELRYAPFSWRQFALAGSAYFTPDVLTFGTADNVSDLSARGEMRVTENVVGMAGWRWLKVNVPGPGRQSIQDEFIVGVRWSFK